MSTTPGQAPGVAARGASPPTTRSAGRAERPPAVGDIRAKGPTTHRPRGRQAARPIRWHLGPDGVAPYEGGEVDAQIAAASVPPEATSNARNVAEFLPPADWHEFGLATADAAVLWNLSVGCGPHEEVGSRCLGECSPQSPATR